MKYVGVTNNPRRRAAQHRRAGKRGQLRVETGGMSRGKARRWEGTRLARFRKSNKGRNPSWGQFVFEKPEVRGVRLSTGETVKSRN